MRPLLPLVLALCAALPCLAERAKPNVVIMLVDDLGTQGKWKNIAKRRFVDLIDYRELDTLLPKLPPADAVFHMGANSSTTSTDGDEILRVNLRATMAWWQWCTQHGTPFIYASSAATYGDGEQGFNDDQAPEALDKLAPLNLYGWSKHQFDKWAVERASEGKAPPQWAGLKFFNVYGPNEGHKGGMKSVVAQIWPKVQADEPVTLFRSHNPAYADGGQMRDFIYVDDVCKVNLWFWQNPQHSGIFNCGTGRAEPFQNVAEAVIKHHQKGAIEYIPFPDHLKGRYQSFTQADLTRLRGVGYDGEFKTVAEGVADYMAWLNRA